MVNFGLFAVAEGLLVSRGRGGGVLLDLDLENGRVETLGRPEGCQDNRCLQGLGSDAQLDWEVFLRLCVP